MIWVLRFVLNYFRFPPPLDQPSLVTSKVCQIYNLFTVIWYELVCSGHTRQVQVWTCWEFSEFHRRKHGSELAGLAGRLMVLAIELTPKRYFFILQGLLQSCGCRAYHLIPFGTSAGTKTTYSKQRPELLCAQFSVQMRILRFLLSNFCSYLNSVVVCLSAVETEL